MQAVEQLVERHDTLKGKHANTPTLQTKTGWSEFIIVEFLYEGRSQ